MPRIPLEDNFTDVIGKAQRGLKLSDANLAEKAGLSRTDLAAIQGGEIRELALLAVARPLGLERNALLPSRAANGIRSSHSSSAALRCSTPLSRT